jgi:hypothetical protein
VNHPTAQKDTPAWIFFVWASFVISTTLMGFGILFAPVEFWVKGYLGMGMFFTIAAAFTLAKTVRDNAEAQKLVNRMVDAKTEKILSEYELRQA